MKSLEIFSRWDSNIARRLVGSYQSLPSSSRSEVNTSGWKLPWRSNRWSGPDPWWRRSRRLARRGRQWSSRDWFVEIFLEKMQNCFKKCWWNITLIVYLRVFKLGFTEPKDSLNRTLGSVKMSQIVLFLIFALCWSMFQRFHWTLVRQLNFSRSCKNHCRLNAYVGWSLGPPIFSLGPFK
jgi:hypothetical protein